jgi:hypothetical protein
MPGIHQPVTFNAFFQESWTYHLPLDLPGDVLARHAGRYFATPKFFRNIS